jgi:BMFP domain-containing protein YqiC
MDRKMHRNGAKRPNESAQKTALLNCPGISLRRLPMIRNKLFDDFAERIAELARTAPAKDLEKNAKALLGGMLQRMDIATRADLDDHAALITRLYEQIQALELRIAALEQTQRSADPT